MNYFQQVLCWLVTGLLGGVAFLCLQPMPSIPILWIRLSLLAVPATYTVIGILGLIVDRTLDKSPEQDENYQWLVYIYPLLFLVSSSIGVILLFLKGFGAILGEIFKVTNIEKRASDIANAPYKGLKGLFKDIL
jgi:hypothetical protein